MKKVTITLAATFLFFNLLFAHNGDPLKFGKTTTTKTEKPSFDFADDVVSGAISLRDIFISDYDGVTLYIDFQAVREEVSIVKVLKEEKIIMEDEVSELPSNTIYELDLQKLNAGTYNVELTTAQNISIRMELVVE